MPRRAKIGPLVALMAILLLTACAGKTARQAGPAPDTQQPRESHFLDLFKTKDDPNVTMAVNKYLWNASLEVLNFLPIQSADPFSGVIVTGYGTPPGGRQSYRATILIQDPALDARSLNVAIMTRAGPVDEATRAAVETAILTRARQLRVADLGL